MALSSGVLGCFDEVVSAAAAAAPALPAPQRKQLMDRLDNLREALTEDDEWAKEHPDDRMLRVALLGSVEDGIQAVLHFFLRGAASGQGHKSHVELITGQKQHKFARQGRIHKTQVPCNGELRTLLLRTTTDDPSPNVLHWADSFLLFFDAADRRSFDDIHKLHEKMVTHRKAPALPCMVVGIHGLADKQAVITDNELDAAVQSLQDCVAVVSIDPHKGTGVDRLFHDISHATAASLPQERTLAGAGRAQSNAAMLRLGGSAKNGSGGRSPSSPRRMTNAAASKPKPSSSGPPPLKEGYLRKLSSKQSMGSFKRRWVILTPGKLTYYANQQAFQSQMPGKSIDLSTATVKVPRRPSSMALVGSVKSSGGPGGAGSATPSSAAGSSRDRPIFSIVTLQGRSWQFETVSEEDMRQWTLAIEAEILASLNRNLSGGLKGGKKAGDRGVFSVLSATEIEQIRAVEGNSRCVDCDAPAPTWASLNLGIVMCISCGGIHRNLGVHISRVRSLELDDFRESYVTVLKAIGNTRANKIWEAQLPSAVKPQPSSSLDDRALYIRKKYIDKAFLAPPVATGAEAILSAVKANDVTAGLLAVIHTPPKEAVKLVPGEGTTAIHVAAQRDDVFWTQMLLWLEPNAASLNNAQDKLPEAPNNSQTAALLQEARDAASEHSLVGGSQSLGSTTAAANDGASSSDDEEDSETTVGSSLKDPLSALNSPDLGPAPKASPLATPRGAAPTAAAAAVPQGQRVQGRPSASPFDANFDVSQTIAGRTTGSAVPKTAASNPFGQPPAAANASSSGNMAGVEPIVRSTGRRSLPVVPNSTPPSSPSTAL